MVGFSDSRSMGEAATSSANSNYKNTITFMKRLVGLPFDDPRAQKEMKRVNYKCVPVKHRRDRLVALQRCSLCLLHRQRLLVKCH